MNDTARPHIRQIINNFALLKARENDKFKLAPVLECGTDAGTGNTVVTIAFIEGASFESLLLVALRYKDKIAFWQLLQVYRDLVSQFKINAVSNPSESTAAKTCAGAADSSLCATHNVDMLFEHIISRDDLLYVIGYEWVLNVPEQYVYYRAASAFFARHGAVVSDTITPEEVFSFFGIAGESLPVFQLMEKQFQSYIYGQDGCPSNSSYEQGRLRFEDSVADLAALGAQLSVQRTVLEQKEDALLQKDAQLAEVCHELSAVLQSRKYRWALKTARLVSSIFPAQSRRRNILEASAGVFIVLYSRARELKRSLFKRTAPQNAAAVLPPIQPPTQTVASVSDTRASASVLPEKAVSTASKRILLVSYYCPTRAHAGGLRTLDMYALIKEKMPGVQLDLYTFHRPEIDGAIKEAQELFDKIYYSPVPELTAGGLAALQGKQPRYDVIDLQHHYAAVDWAGLRGLCEKIIFTPMESVAKSFFLDLRAFSDSGSILQLRGMAQGLKLATEEIDFCSKVNEVVCVSRTDAAFLRAITSLENITPLETGISRYEFASALSSGNTCLQRNGKRIIYVAYFGSQTNILALKWYLDNVHELVKKQVPDYIFTIVGRGDLKSFQQYSLDPQIEMVGEVPAIAPYIEKAALGIAPALGGAGFRGKINQYAICGLPSVVSPIAAEGLAYKDGIDIFMAENPVLFSRRCVELLTDASLNETMGRRARETCLANYTWESKWKAIAAIYTLDGTA